MMYQTLIADLCDADRAIKSTDAWSGRDVFNVSDLQRHYEQSMRMGGG
jgi:hypothetical protein